MKKNLPVLFALFFALATAGYCQESYEEEIVLAVGKTATIKVDLPKRLAINNPNVADISSATKTEVVLMGKAKGITTFFVLDRKGERNWRIKVLPEDTDYLNEQIAVVIKSLGLNKVYTKPLPDEGKILLLGTVRTQEERERLQSALGELAAKSTDLLKIEEESLVEISLEVLELNKDASKTLGFSFPSSFTFTNPPHGDVSLASTSPAWNLIDGSKTSFSSTLDLLLQEGKARLLSRPRLVCQSGKEAELLVGGEVPIFESSTSDGETSTSVQYKEYGIKLNISPVVSEAGKIQLALNIDISEIGNAETIGSPSAPTAKAYPLSKRTISTQLHMNDGDTLTIGGLIKQKSEEDLKKFPWLADIPVLGVFFRHKDLKIGGGAGKRADTELFITLTPKIIFSRETESQKEKRLTRVGKQELRKANRRVNIPSELQDYMLNIQKKALSQISYPRTALGTGWEGDVVVRLCVSDTGEIKEAAVVKSSGYKIFDNDALSSVKKIKYPPFPASIDLPEIKIDIPISYQSKK